MFRSATIRLTAWYLLLIMIISLSFSAFLYQALSQDIGVGFRRQTEAFFPPPNPGPTASPAPFLMRDGGIPGGISREEIDRIRNQQLEITQKNLRRNLGLINLAVLILGAGASLLLARRTLKPIEEALDAQGRFTADASHELRTPLAAMRAEIEVALRAKPLSRQALKKILGSNLEEIAKLESLSTALLKLANQQNGIPKSARKSLSSKDVLTEAKKKVAALADQRKMSLTVTGIGRISGDRQSLVELFVILFENAIKYSPEHTKVTASAKLEGNRMRIKVTDQGIGIKASDIPHVFNRFYRADTSRSTRNISGYGLGLSIAEQIVRAHNGRISVISTPNKGSSFLVELPQA